MRLREAFGVTDPAQVAHVALGKGTLEVVTVDNQQAGIGGKDREYFVASPGEHTIEIRMSGYYQSTSNAKIKINAKAGHFILLCPVLETLPFAKTGTWGVIALSRPSQTPLTTTRWRADGYDDYSHHCAPWISVVEEQDIRAIATGKDNYWTTTTAARDFRDAEGRSVVDLARQLRRPNRAAEFVEAGY